jgi:hypothetical protein
MVRHLSVKGACNKAAISSNRPWAYITNQRGILFCPETDNARPKLAAMQKMRAQFYIFSPK